MKKSLIGMIAAAVSGVLLLSYYFGILPNYFLAIGKGAGAFVIIAIWIMLMLTHFSLILWDKKMPLWVVVFMSFIYVLSWGGVILTLNSKYAAFGIVGILIFLVLTIACDRYITRGSQNNKK